MFMMPAPGKTRALCQGRLVVFEGVARVGKTTLVQSVQKWLTSLGEAVVTTEWNSYPALQAIINEKKSNQTLTPLSYSLLHLADFALRHEEIVVPSLSAGRLVLADRWIYTALARDTARGVPSAFVETAYGFARRPDLVLYLEVPLEVALNRLASTKAMTPYNTGFDIWPDQSPEEAFRAYYVALTATYDLLARKHGWIRLDGRKSQDALLDEARAAVVNAFADSSRG
jgi:dTMP kinase